MKNKQYEASKIKKMLLQKKRDGVKEVIWRVDSQARKDEIRRLGFPMIPWLYEIKTRPFKQIAGKPTIIKDIHYAYKRGKMHLVRRLTEEDVKFLREYGVTVRELKYKIKLV